MTDYIYYGNQRAPVRPIPGFCQIGAARIDRDWRVIDLETMAVIGPMLKTYGLLCSYAAERYQNDYS